MGSLHSSMAVPEEGIGSLGTRAVDGGESPCGCWEPNPGPLQELLTTEPSPQPQPKLCVKSGEHQDPSSMNMDMNSL